MAENEKSLIRRIVAVFDRTAAKKVEAELEATLTTAGAKGGANFARELRSAFDQRMAQLKVQLAQGLIDPAAFRQQGDIAARQFNAGILRGIEDARKAGTLTDREFLKLSKTLKVVGADGKAAMAGVGHAATAARGPVAALRGGLQSLLVVMRPLLVAFTGIRALMFGRASVEAAIEEKKAFDELAATLANVGVAYEDVAEEIKATQRSLEAAGVTDDEAASILSRLVTITRDYKGSLAQVGLVADVAAGTHKSLEEASTLVGKAMVGNTKALRQWGITTKDSEEAIKQLHTTFDGRAASMLTVSERLSKGWGEFKEALGRALLAMIGGEKGFDRLTGWIQDATHWLEDNERGFARWGRVAVTSIGAVLKVLLLVPQTIDKVSIILAEGLALLADRNNPASWARLSAAWEGLKGDFSGADKAITEASNALGVALGLLPDLTTETKRAGRAVQNFTGDLDNQTDAEKKATEAAEKKTEAERQRQAEVLAGMARDTEVSNRMAAAVRQGEAAVRALNRELFIEEALLRANAVAGTVFADQVARMAGEAFDAARALERARTPEEEEKVADKGAEAATDELARAETFATPWLKALDAIRTEVEAQHGIFEELGEAWASGGFKGLAALAKRKVKENLASAIEMIARALGSFALGNPTAAALFLKSAAQHGVAAAAWRGLAGGGGGGGGAGGAGGGGSDGGRPNLGAGASLAPNGPEVHIYLTGPGFDALNPRVQEVVYKAEQMARERFGQNSTVTIRRST